MTVQSHFWSMLGMRKANAHAVYPNMGGDKGTPLDSVQPEFSASSLEEAPAVSEDVADWDANWAYCRLYWIAL